jgi:hypothetical protein
VLVAPYFGCLSVSLSRRFLLWMMEDVDFGDDCSTVLASIAPGKSVKDGSSSWKMDVQLWIEKKESLFVIFGTSR